MNTRNCINCGKPAVQYTGHVHTETGLSVCAGWCMACVHLAEREGYTPKGREAVILTRGRSNGARCQGCYGRLLKRDGVTQGKRQKQGGGV